MCVHACAHIRERERERELDSVVFFVAYVLVSFAIKQTTSRISVA